MCPLRGSQTAPGPADSYFEEDCSHTMSVMCSVSTTISHQNGSSEQICCHFLALIDKGSILDMSGISLIQSVRGLTKKELLDEELWATGGISPIIQR